MYFYKKYLIYTGVIFFVSVFAGCFDSSSGTGDNYLVRIGSQVVTAGDFSRLFEAENSMDANDSLEYKDTLKDAKLLFLSQMIEEMFVLERAKELDIRISDDQLANAVAQIKKDYPEDSFNNMLLEQVISYCAWEKKLKTRILIEKVIEKDLGAGLKISHADISDYYEKHYNKDVAGNESNYSLEDLKDLIFKHLRREKIETAYKIRIYELKKKYKVDINKPEWEKIIGSSEGSR